MTLRRNLKIFASLPVFAGVYGLLFSLSLLGDELIAPDMEPWQPFWNTHFAKDIPSLQFELKPFFAFLALAKFLGTGLLWSPNRYLEKVGNVILCFPAGLGGYMNWCIGDPIAPPLIWSLVNFYLLFTTEKVVAKGAKTE